MSRRRCPRTFSTDDPVRMYLKEIGRISCSPEEEKGCGQAHGRRRRGGAKHRMEEEPNLRLVCRLQSAMWAGACSCSISFKRAIWGL